MNAPTTVAVTLSGGVLLLGLSRWLQQSFMAPRHKPREVMGEIDFLVVHFTHFIATPKAEQSLGPEQVTERQAEAPRRSMES